MRLLITVLRPLRAPVVYSRAHYNPDGSEARVGDFITGFERRNDSGGKPVGLAADGAGNIYLSSDWITNIIVRIELPRPSAVKRVSKLRLPGIDD